jgi:hypothetical protein
MPMRKPPCVQATLDLSFKGVLKAAQIVYSDATLVVDRESPPIAEVASWLPLVDPSFEAQMI